MVVNIVYIYIYCNIYGIIFSDKFTQEGARELQIGLEFHPTSYYNTSIIIYLSTICSLFSQVTHTNYAGSHLCTWLGAIPKPWHRWSMIGLAAWISNPTIMIYLEQSNKHVCLSNQPWKHIETKSWNLHQYVHHLPIISSNRPPLFARFCCCCWTCWALQPRWNAGVLVC